MCQFFLEEKLQFPTRIQITEARKKGEPVLDWFGTIREFEFSQKSSNFWVSSEYDQIMYIEN